MQRSSKEAAAKGMALYKIQMIALAILVRHLREPVAAVRVASARGAGEQPRQLLAKAIRQSVD
jgi:hypothetical protein